jgi:glycerophosphoryl diester phosphodiesterase
MSSLNSAGSGPFVVAHRAGNDLRSLRRAETAQVAIVEADLHLYAGRVEVRHLKTMGPMPLLWDRWKLAPAWTPRLQLDRLLDTASRSTALMLDLKGRDVRLAIRVAEALRQRPRDTTLCCSQNWTLLAALRDVADVRVVHSVGSARQLAALRKYAAKQSVSAISIHKRLLDPRRVDELHRQADVVMTWPVLDPVEAHRLAGWGVDGLITQQYEAVASHLQTGSTEEAR